jgi:hypothetical protein
MIRGGQSGWRIGRTARAWPALGCLVLGCLASGWGVCCCRAQEAEPALGAPAPAAASEAAEPIPTLHVYMNLEQIPVLVLSEGHELLKKPVDASRFQVSLDAGPKFKPMHVRVEGDDPIALAVLIDVTNPKSNLLPQVADAVAGLARGMLHEQDRVSIYVMDCALIRTADLMQPEPARLRTAVERGLDGWQRRVALRGKTQACKPALPLWDAMMIVESQLLQEPGRRVLLAVTDGRDAGSRTGWNTVRLAAQTSSTAVFGVQTELNLGTQYAAESLGRGTLGGGAEAMTVVPIAGQLGAEDPFNAICQLSGGVEVAAGKKDLAAQFQRVIGMVRSRYILEYPRGNHDQAGMHSIDVTIRRMDAYIRPAGLTVPVADQKLLADPTTLPTDQSGAPVFGKRKVLPPSSN